MVLFLFRDLMPGVVLLIGAVLYARKRVTLEGCLLVGGSILIVFSAGAPFLAMAFPPLQGVVYIFDYFNQMNVARTVGQVLFAFGFLMAALGMSRTAGRGDGPGGVDEVPNDAMGDQEGMGTA